jgi:hypothetical protein
MDLQGCGLQAPLLRRNAAIGPRSYAVVPARRPALLLTPCTRGPERESTPKESPSHV